MGKSVRDDLDRVDCCGPDPAEFVPGQRPTLFDCRIHRLLGHRVGKAIEQFRHPFSGQTVTRSHFGVNLGVDQALSSQLRSYWLAGNFGVEGESLLDLCLHLVAWRPAGVSNISHPSRSLVGKFTPFAECSDLPCSSG